MGSKTLDFLQEITLRNKHIVYRDKDNFRVAQIKESGEEHAHSILSENIERLMQLCHGKTMTVQQANALFGANCSDLDLPYTYGYKLRYYVQDMLLILVATGKATMSKKGKAYIYHVGI